MRKTMMLPDAPLRATRQRLRSLPRPSRDTILATLLLCIAFYGAAQIGLTLHFPRSLVYFVWPPSVLVFVALVLSPRRLWWIYLLALLPVHLFTEWTSVAAPPSSLLLFYAIVWIQAVVGALCVARFASRPFQISSLRTLITLLLSGAGAAALAEALTLATVLKLTADSDNFWLTFAQTFLAGALTMLVLAPALVIGWTNLRSLLLAGGAAHSAHSTQTWRSGARGWLRERLRTLSIPRALETCLLWVGLLLVGLVAFGGYIAFPSTLPALLYAVLPLLLWTGARFGVGTTGLALCGLTLLSIVYAVHGRGPFSALSTTENLFSLQLFFIAISVPLLVVAALMREHMATEAVLQESEARYRDLVESQVELICRYLPDGTLTFVNEAYCRWYGRSREELVGTSFVDFLDASARRHHLSYMSSLMEHPYISTDEHEVVLPDGSIGWQHWVDHPIYNAEGKVIEFQAIGRDITPRRRAEQALRESEERYRALVNNLPHGAVLLFGQDLRHLVADGQGLPEIGLVKDAIEGKTPSEALPADLSIALEPRYLAALSGDHAAFDLTYVGHTYQVQTLPIRYANTSAGMAVIQDVTVQRRAEMLAELDRAKTAFFSNVSHEFRTPLTLLLGPAADALVDCEQPLPPHQRERVELIQRGGLRLHKLVNTLLDFSRIEAGRLSAVYVPTDLAVLTAELAGAFRSAIERAGLRLVVECPPLTGLAQPIYVDRDLWEKIVFNLLSNALKFTFDGEVVVTLRPGPAHDGVQLEVRDTGTGIPAAELSHVFERFHRVQGARARTHEGTGIGLALVHELVRLHGGTVRVESAVNIGSRFVVSIPTGSAHLPADHIAALAPSAAESDSGLVTPAALGAPPFVEEALAWVAEPHRPQGAPTSAELSAPADASDPLNEHARGPLAWGDGPLGPESPQQPDLSHARILVVDDNADMRAYLVRLLRERWEVEAVADGTAALLVARAQPPDLIVSDVMLPGQDDFALVRALRADPATHAIPVLLLSARAGEEATVEGLEAGADDYLVKPFAARELLARVRTHLELSWVRRQAAAHSAQLDAIFEAITDGVLVHDRDGRTVRANSAYRDLLQRYLEMQQLDVDMHSLLASQPERERVFTINDERGRAVPPEQWTTRRALQGETLTGANAVDEYYPGPDGRDLHTSVSAAPIRDADGAIIGAVSVFRDVTSRRQLERQVAEQASQLEATFAAMTDGVVVIDAEGRVTKINRALRMLFGSSPGSDIPSTSEERARGLDLLDAGGQPLSSEQMPTARLLRGEVLSGAQAMTLQLRTHDGHERIVSLTGGPLREATGHIVGGVAIVRDTTNLKRAEVALAAQERLFRTLVENSPDIITRFDRNLRHLYVSPAAEVVTGVPAEARIGKTYAELALPEALYGPWEDALREVIASGEPRAFETRLELPNTPIRYSQVRYIPEFAADGSVESVLGITSDITQLKQAEIRLAEQASQLEAVFEAMTEGVTITDAQGRLVKLNRAAHEMLGISADPDYVDLPYPQRVANLHARDAQGVLIPYERMLLTRALNGEVIAAETAPDTVITTPDGRHIMLSRSAASIRDAQGQVIGAVIVHRDVTERRQLEQQARDNASQLEAIFEAKADGVAVFDTQGHFVRANRALRELLGFDADPAYTTLPLSERAQRLLVFDEHDQRVPDEQWPHWRALRGEILAGANTEDYRVRTLDGRDLWISIAGAPIYAPSGDLTGAVLITRDVTAHRQLERQVREHERQYRTLIESLPDIIARFDRDLRYLYVSPAIRGMTDTPLEAFVGKTNQELGWPESSYSRAHRAIERTFQTGRSSTLEEVTPPGADPQQARYFQERFLPELDEDGTVSSVLTVTTEITDLKRAEEALRAAKREEEQRRREAERREQIAGSLRDVLTILNLKRPLPKTLHYIAGQAGRLLGTDAAAIYTVDPMDGGVAGSIAEDFAPQAAYALPPFYASDRGERHRVIGQAALRTAMAERRPVVVLPVSAMSSHGPGAATPDDASAASADSTDTAYIVVREESLPAPFQALLAVPIISQDDVYGGMVLLYSEAHDFSDDELALAIAYVDQIALALANARLQDHIERAATETERTRLARELHDTVTQEIFSASLLAEAIPRVWEHHRAEAEQSFQQLHQLTRGALAALRALLLELRPVVLEQTPLAELLRQLAAAMTTRSGVPITLAIEDDHPPLPLHVKIALYRVAQEALTNAAKHARAQQIIVCLRGPRDDQTVELEIGDDGQGFDLDAVPPGHFGIDMMRDRARGVGATLRVNSLPTRGTHVVVEWKGSAGEDHATVGRGGRVREGESHGRT